MGMKWEKIGRFAVILLLLLNVTEIIAFYKIGSETGLYDLGHYFPLPSGYQLNHRFTAAMPSGCSVIRLTADGCRYCRQDQTEYTRLLQEAEKIGCRTITVAPKYGQIKPDSGSNVPAQIQWVDMKLGRALNPFLTPQTILLDRVGRIMWKKEGSMDGRSLSGALRAMKILR
jgi:hypothetical protein